MTTQSRHFLFFLLASVLAGDELASETPEVVNDTLLLIGVGLHTTKSGQQQALSSADLMLMRSMALGTSYSLWFEEPKRLQRGLTKDEYMTSLRRFAAFETFGEFLKAWEGLQALTGEHKSLARQLVATFSSVHLFRSEVQPAWEDPANENGGKLTICFKDVNKAIETFLRVGVSLMCSQLGAASDVCGVVLNFRGSTTTLQVWNLDAETNNVVKLKRDVLKLVGLCDALYKPHRESIARNHKTQASCWERLGSAPSPLQSKSSLQDMCVEDCNFSHRWFGNHVLREEPTSCETSQHQEPRHASDCGSTVKESSTDDGETSSSDEDAAIPGTTSDGEGAEDILLREAKKKARRQRQKENRRKRRTAPSLPEPAEPLPLARVSLMEIEAPLESSEVVEAGRPSVGEARTWSWSLGRPFLAASLLAASATLVALCQL